MKIVLYYTTAFLIVFSLFVLDHKLIASDNNSNPVRINSNNNEMMQVVLNNLLKSSKETSTTAPNSNDCSALMCFYKYPTDQMNTTLNFLLDQARETNTNANDFYNKRTNFNTIFNNQN